MAETREQATIFDGGSPKGRRTELLGWDITFRMCWSNVVNRMGRSALTFLGIAVVSAFFMSSFCYQSMLSDLTSIDDVHTRAVLSRAGVYANDAKSLQRQDEQRTWLMILSALVCLTGVTNTILMSVNERVREIGALKCIGALDAFIVRLFLLENLLLGLVGSAVGAVVGYLLSLLQVGWSLEFGLMSFELCLRALIYGAPLSIGAGAGLTVLAAIYPTRVAARMKPVDAMRSEV